MNPLARFVSGRGRLWQWGLRASVSVLLALGLATPSRADGPGKAQPPGFDRELSTDRPDVTESPRTVPRGRVQIEGALAGAAFDRWRGPGEPRSDRYEVGGFNAKLGITNHIDFQAVFAGWTVVREASGTERRREEGAGDLSVRLKWNLWGNDEGATALALLPYGVIPSGKDGVGAGTSTLGLAIPFAWDFAEGWSAATMAEFAWTDPGGEGTVGWLQSASIGRDIGRDVGIYVELVFECTDGTGSATASAGAGGTYAISDDVQLDGGMNFGLTRDAVDWNPFLGLTVRF